MRNYFTFLLLLITGISFGQRSNENDILFKIDDEPTYLSEFKYVYDKNNSNQKDAYTKENLDEYLNLYIKFKLKVKEAKSLGLDTLTELINELDGYKSALAKPYLSEKKVTDNLIKEAYSRLEKTVRASHILILAQEDAGPEDTLAALKKIKEIKKRIDAGEDFSALAKETSEDPSAKQNAGDLGYFTVFQMVYPFESAAYKTPVGEVSSPFRTRFGYHILKVTDKTKNDGKLKVAHIMVKAADDIPSDDSIKAKNKIDMICQQLQNGKSWEELNELYSEDEARKAGGGVIRPFGVGESRLPSFEAAAFKLNKTDEYSAPVKTPYGWHIIKLIEKKGIPSFEEHEQQLKTLINRDERSQLNQKVLIKRLKQENNYKENKNSLKFIQKNVDSSLVQGAWKYDTTNKKIKKWLFKIKEKSYSIEDFFKSLYTIQSKKPGASYQITLNKHLKNYIEQKLMEYEESHLADKYYDYKMLYKEYQEGILIFQLMQDSIWTKASKDTSGLRLFYETIKHEHQWPERVQAKIYALQDTSQMPLLQAMLSAGESDLNIEASLNKANPLNLSIRFGFFEKGKDDVIDNVTWKQGQYNVMKNGVSNLVIIEDYLPSEPKKLKEARGLFISEYQNYLEEIWIEKLKSRYKVDITEGMLEKLIK